MLTELESCDHITPLTSSKAAERLTHLGAVGDLATVRSLLKNKKAVFAEITYDYGDLVVADGTFRLPGMQFQLNSRSKAVDCKACAKLQTCFNKDENPVPLLLNLNKELEVFRIYTDVSGEDEFGYRAVPVAYRKKGELIGVFENLRPPTYSPSYGSFYVCAGSRNVHLVLPLEPKHSTLADRAGLKTAFSKYVRETAKETDLKEYGLRDSFLPSSNPHSPRVPYKLEGIASDWRIIRTVIGKPTWKSSLLMILVDREDRDSLLKMPETALALFRTGFFQLQEPLEAFAAEGPTHSSDIGIFMNVDKPSVPAVWNHICACIEGKSFVHIPVVSDGDMGPWGEMFKAMAKHDPAENEITVRNYVPLILEPAKLDQFTAKGFVSFNHLLIPQGLFLGVGDNGKWAAGGKFAARLRDRHISELTKEYPFVKERNTEERIRFLEESRKDCWPDTAVGAQILGAFKVVGQSDDKLSRLTCLREFMTVRYSKSIGIPDHIGANPA